MPISITMTSAFISHSKYHTQGEAEEARIVLNTLANLHLLQSEILSGGRMSSERGELISTQTMSIEKNVHYHNIISTIQQQRNAVELANHEFFCTLNTCGGVKSIIETDGSSTFHRCISQVEQLLPPPHNNNIYMHVNIGQEKDCAYRS